MQQCTDCGMQLPSHVAICPRCGKTMPYVPPASTADNYAERMPANYNSSWDIVPGSPGSAANRMSTPLSANSGSQAYPQMQQSFYSSPSQPPYSAQTQQAEPFGTPRLPPRRQGISKTMTILLAALALLIMSGGIGLIYYTAVAHPAQLQGQATATVQAMSTANAQSIGAANAQATGTAQSYTQATATTQAQTQATATAFENLYIKATSAVPVLNSSLAFQTGSNWDTYNAVGGGGCAFTGGALHASVSQKSFYVPCFAHATRFSNFAFEVQMTILKGDDGGLIFRANDVTTQFYIFRVGQDGTYSLFVAKDDKHNTSIVDDQSSSIKTGAGQPNLLTVIAQGNNIYLYINKQFVGSASDGTYGSGEIGFFASDTNNATDVAFSNARVWAL